MTIKFSTTFFDWVFLLERDIFHDNRWSFSELYRREKFREFGINTPFIQDNISFSKKGVLRGLHFQKNHPQAKLLFPLSGRILDVVLDLRKESKTYGKSQTYILEEGNWIFISKGLAHGFLALSDVTVYYTCDDFYYPDDEGGVHWSNSSLEIDWQSIFDTYEIHHPIVSEKDAKLPFFSFEQK